jgi:RNA polymerase sigma factor (TIGR02999 family)
VSDFTQILEAAEQGEKAASQKLLDLVYEQLRHLAACKMAQEAPGQTLQPTALVHEAWLRLGGDAQPTWQNRAQFFSVAAEAMRRILIERARRKKAMRHGGGQVRIDFEHLEIGLPIENDDRLLALDESLERFTAVDPAKAHLVNLRYFVGLTNSEAAEILGISEPTAKRWWAYSKAWLYRSMEEETAGPPKEPR